MLYIQGGIQVGDPLSLSCREYSVRLSRMAALPHTVHPELVDAARKREWERVEVRRPLGGDFNSECGPLRAVCLGLCQSTHEAVVARRTRPCSAECSPLRRHMKPSSHAELGLALPNAAPCVRRPPGDLEFARRRSSMRVTTLIHVTCTLPCERARSPASVRVLSLEISRRLRRPQSPFSRLSELSPFLRMHEWRSGWRVLRVRPEYSFR